MSPDQASGASEAFLLGGIIALSTSPRVKALPKAVRVVESVDAR